jgi:hypothetical protein
MNTHLYHLSPRRNLVSILEHGLRLSCAQSRQRVIWLCEGHRVAWGVRHIEKRHVCPVDYLSIFQVNVPVMDCKKFRDGIWLYGKDVPPASVLCVAEYALGEP